MIIRAQKINKSYGHFIALKNASITVEEGAIYGLVGKNGAGKTTLLKCVLGLTQKDSGKILISESSALHKQRKKIGFMIGLPFYGYLNAFENIEYYRRLKGIEDKDETQRVLKIVGLENAGKKKFKAFSMGMKQRLGVANALLGSPSIIILDEPNNGLDPEGIIEIREMIKELHEKEGMTFIISSHQLMELDLIATHFGFVNEGQIIKQISKDEFQDETGFYLIIETDRPKELEQCLKKAFPEINEAKVDTTSLKIPDFSGDVHYIADFIIRQGFELKGIHQSRITLEDYFMNIIHSKV